MRTDVVDCLLHGGDFLGVLVRNLGFELLFQRHDEVARIQRIRSEVVDERRFVLDLSLVHAQLLGDDLPDPLLYVFHATPPLAGSERSKGGDFTRRDAFAKRRGYFRARGVPRVSFQCLLHPSNAYCIYMPPLTCNVAPVTYAAPGEARNATACATS